MTKNRWILTIDDQPAFLFNTREEMRNKKRELRNENTGVKSMRLVRDTDTGEGYNRYYEVPVS